MTRLRTRFPAPPLGSTRAAGAARLLLAVWWSSFAALSFYWAAGGSLMIGSALRDKGLQLLHERPAGLVALVAVAGVGKLAVALYGYLPGEVAPGRVPLRPYRGVGFVVGVGLVGYGLLRSVPGVVHVVGGHVTGYEWMGVLVWGPQFWLGGLLLIWTALTLRPPTEDGSPT